MCNAGSKEVKRMTTVKCGRCGNEVELGYEVELIAVLHHMKPDGTFENTSESETLCDGCYKAL